MIIDCIADLHGFYPELEGGDLLIVGGDLTARDEPDQLWHFCQWMIDQNYKLKVVIAGNHDNTFYVKYYKNHEFPFVPFIYLCDSGTEFEGLKIWGSPWTKTFEGMNPHCKAFTFDTEEKLEKKWQMISPDTDILITHSPPFGILDGVENDDDGTLSHVGSHSLAYFVKMHQPKLHVFGHIHEGYGKHFYLNESHHPNDIIYVNASHVNEYYKPVNKPVRIEL